MQAPTAMCLMPKSFKNFSSRRQLDRLITHGPESHLLVFGTDVAIVLLDLRGTRSVKTLDAAGTSRGHKLALGIRGSADSGGSLWL